MGKIAAVVETAGNRLRSHWWQCGALWDVSELRETVLLPLRRRKHGNMDTKSAEIRPGRAEPTALCAPLASPHREDKKMRGG